MIVKPKTLLELINFDPEADTFEIKIENDTIKIAKVQKTARIIIYLFF